MKIVFVGHASFLVEAAGKKLLTDPWFSGKVFNEGWALSSRPHPIDWTAIDYIWISHEHPDHFHFPTLKSIPAAEKARIVVLYQRHASKRIFEAIKNLGFAHVVELPLYQWYLLLPELSLYCGSVGSKDSFLAVRDAQDTVLNLNDCVLNPAQCRYIRDNVGRPALLFTQFSASSTGWETTRMKSAARNAKWSSSRSRSNYSSRKPLYLLPASSTSATERMSG